MLILQFQFDLFISLCLHVLKYISDTRFMCIHVSSGVVLAELSFKLEPSDIIAVQEQPLMLHCQVDGVPPITTHWRRNGLLLTQDQHHTTFINGSLLISRFQKTKSDRSSDEGDYECMAQNSFGRLVSRKARIQAASKFCYYLFIIIIEFCVF